MKLVEQLALISAYECLRVLAPWNTNPLRLEVFCETSSNPFQGWPASV
jgi:hypothetical protein